MASWFRVPAFAALAFCAGASDTVQVARTHADSNCANGDEVVLLQSTKAMPIRREAALEPYDGAGDIITALLQRRGLAGGSRVRSQSYLERVLSTKKGQSDYLVRSDDPPVFEVPPSPLEHPPPATVDLTIAQPPSADGNPWNTPEYGTNGVQAAVAIPERSGEPSLESQPIPPAAVEAAVEAAAATAAEAVPASGAEAPAESEASLAVPEAAPESAGEAPAESEAAPESSAEAPAESEAAPSQ